MDIHKKESFQRWMAAIWQCKTCVYSEGVRGWGSVFEWGAEVRKPGNLNTGMGVQFTTKVREGPDKTNTKKENPKQKYSSTKHKPVLKQREVRDCVGRHNHAMKYNGKMEVMAHREAEIIAACTPFIIVRLNGKLTNLLIKRPPLCQWSNGGVGKGGSVRATCSLHCTATARLMPQPPLPTLYLLSRPPWL